MLGRHRWTTVVDSGETYVTCTGCGRSPRRQENLLITQADLDYMKTSGQSDGSISGGY